jgi:condensin complex subunit 2
MLSHSTTLPHSSQAIPADDDDDDDFGGEARAFNAGDEGGAPPVEDFFMGADAAADDFGGDTIDGDDNSDGSDSGSPVGESQRGAAEFVLFDSRHLPTERGLVVSMTDAGREEDAMDYFDQNLLKNWAGPEHWKLRKVIWKRRFMPVHFSRQFANERLAEADAGANKAAKPRQRKEAFKVDFLSPNEDGKGLKEIANAPFAPVTKGTGINLLGTGATSSKKGKRKGTKKKEKKDDRRLPGDVHFSSRQVVALFLKLKFHVSRLVLKLLHFFILPFSSRFGDTRYLGI